MRLVAIPGSLRSVGEAVPDNDTVMMSNTLAGVIAQKGNFQGSALRGSDFTGADVTGSSFRGSDVREANFAGAHLTDLRKTTFGSCLFLGVDFTYSDLRGLRLDGQTFLGVTFDQAALKDASFQGATLKHVSFHVGSIWSTNGAIKSISFDGAMMDKLTYAALKGLEADVSKVTVLS